MENEHVEALLASLGARGTKLSDSLTSMNINLKTIRNSLSTAAKWRQLGYSPFVPDAAGFTALHRAALKGDVTLVKSLVGTYEGNVLEFCLLATKKQGHTAMHIACKAGHVPAIKALLSVPQSTQLLLAKDIHGNTPLHFAATSTVADASHVLEVILPHMPAGRLDDTNAHSLSPLAAHLVTTTIDSPEITRLFLERRVDPNAWVRRENTLLHVATERKLWKIAAVLVEFGAEWNVPDNHNMMVTDMVGDTELSFLVKFVANCKEWATAVRRDCQSCKRSFSFFRRRHHCRLCGRVLCGKCTKHRRRLFPNGKEKAASARVCNVCVHAIADESSGNSATDVTDPSLMEASAIMGASAYMGASAMVESSAVMEASTIMEASYSRVDP
ncbi:myosin-like protein [Achlya hypogyna]|uniref:Myosin-like protein n=1 Tax=Achlya hypogyna TaxID=1202772 RepID=A0A1V9YL17_ACHHY|nr:myosin-like protein [Achlya hypogyna]